MVNGLLHRIGIELSSQFGLYSLFMIADDKTTGIRLVTYWPSDMV